MFAKQAAWSASLVALCGAAAVARAEDGSSAQPEGEAWVNDVDELPPLEPGELPHEPLAKPIEKPSGRFTLGAGFSTDEGFVAAAEIEVAKRGTNLYVGIAACNKIDIAYGIAGPARERAHQLVMLALGCPQHVDLVGRALGGDATALEECLAIVRECDEVVVDGRRVLAAAGAR